MLFKVNKVNVGIRAAIATTVIAIKIHHNAANSEQLSIQPSTGCFQDHISVPDSQRLVRRKWWSKAVPSLVSYLAAECRGPSAGPGQFQPITP